MAPHYWVFEVWIFLLILLILYYAGRQAGRQQHSERHDLLLPHFLPGWYGIISSRPARTLSSFDVTNAMRVVTQIVCNSLV